MIIVEWYSEFDSLPMSIIDHSECVGVSSRILKRFIVWFVFITILIDITMASVAIIWTGDETANECNDAFGNADANTMS